MENAPNTGEGNATMASIAQATEPQFDAEMGQFIAITITGLEVYGETWTECAERLFGANDTAVAHAMRDPMGLDCSLGPCAKCDALTRGKCDWKGYADAGD